MVCDCCGETLQGNLVRGHAFYRCKLSRDNPVPIDGHPQSLAVREDQLAGIPAEVIASRIAATNGRRTRPKRRWRPPLCHRSPSHSPRWSIRCPLCTTLPELLETIEQADRAALNQALGLTVRYRRNGTTEQVKLTSTLRSVDLERVGVKSSSEDSQVPDLQGVDLERVGGGT